MPSNIPGNVAKHSGEYRQTFRFFRDFNYKENQTSPPKVAVFDCSVVLGSDDSNQNGDVNKSIDNIQKSDFIITLLKGRTSLLEQQLIEKNAIIDLFV